MSTRSLPGQERLNTKSTATYFPPVAAVQTSVDDDAGHGREIQELLPPTLDRQLGYFGGADWVMFCYDRRAADVMWNDGHTYGIGTGGWQAFVDTVAPIATRYGVELGGRVPATAALVLDRRTFSAYFIQIDRARTLVQHQHQSRRRREPTSLLDELAAESIPSRPLPRAATSRRLGRARLRDRTNCGSP